MIINWTNLLTFLKADKHFSSTLSLFIISIHPLSKNLKRFRLFYQAMPFIDNPKYILKDEENVQTFPNVSSITIHLPEDAVLNSGIFYFFIKSLAWEGINILDILYARWSLSWS